MTSGDRKRYIRLIYKRAFGYLGVCLVLSALAGGLFGDTLYTVYALCALGMVMICFGYFTHLKASGMLPFARLKEKARPRVPYMLKRFKDKRPARPAFLMDSRDFDDDLTQATAVSEDIFTREQITRGRVISRVAAGAILIVISFFI